MKTIIYGNGSIARLLFSYARHSLDIAGFTVDAAFIEEGASKFCGLDLVPYAEVETVFPTEYYQMIVAVGFVEMNAVRELILEDARAKGYSLASYIHESVIRHDDVSLGNNNIILDHVSIHPGCKIAEGVFISSNVNIGHDCRIDTYNWINSGVSIAGGCQLGKNGFWGVNACSAHGLNIGANNFIAGNTLINKNSADNDVYFSEAGQKFRLGSKAFLRFSAGMK